MSKLLTAAMLTFGAIASTFANASPSLKKIAIGASCEDVKHVAQSLGMSYDMNPAVECERGSYVRDGRATSSLFESINVNYKERRVISVRYVATWIAKPPDVKRVVDELVRTYGQPSLRSDNSRSNVRPFATIFTGLLRPTTWQLFAWGVHQTLYVPDLPAHEQAGVAGNSGADRGVSGTFFRAVVLQSKDALELVIDLKANSITADLEEEQRQQLRDKKAAEERSRALKF